MRDQEDLVAVRVAEMTTIPESMVGIVGQLRAAIAQLESAERAWPKALDAAHSRSEPPEIAKMEELLHSATHETASELAFTLWHLESLLLRVSLRDRFKIFTASQFDRVVQQGWSTALVQELAKEHPSVSLIEFSELIKELWSEWQRLPRAPQPAHG
jgi:hypothetical protein